MADFVLKKFFLTWLKGMGAVVVLGIVLLILWHVPQQQTKNVKEPYQSANLEDAYRRTLAQILGGLALLYGLYLTQRRIVATEDNVRVAQEGQITERFTRAIEQLGHEEMEIRLGGIYALERLAKDSEIDHGPIMEVLTAYVRERAPRQEANTQGAADTPPTDIQAILTVIGRRETTGNNRGNDPLDLTGTQLVGANLEKANLCEANLNKADLHGANLNKADLHGANLNKADLHGANLEKANLEEANLCEADLRWANLTLAALNKADLLGADLCRAALIEADLCEADLRNAKHLTEDEVQNAKNWRKAILPGYLDLLERPA